MVSVCLHIQIYVISWKYLITFLYDTLVSDPRRGCYMRLQAFIFFFFLFFSPATILSGPYLWNRYSQRLQIECATWSCGLILHCCLPSNSLYFIYFFFFATILSGVEFFIFGGSLLGRIQGDREPVSFFIKVTFDSFSSSAPCIDMPGLHGREAGGIPGSRLQPPSSMASDPRWFSGKPH